MRRSVAALLFSGSLIGLVPAVALGQAIRRLRKAKKLSQEKLALLADVDRAYIGQVERGDNNVAVLRLKQIADALEVTVASLMEEARL